MTAIAEKEVLPMRESTTMTKKKQQAKLAELEFAVRAKKNKVSDAIDIYRVAAQAVNLDTKKFVFADKTYAKVASAKNAAKFDEAKEALLVSVASYQEAGANLNAAVDAVRNEYAALGEASGSPARYDAECEKYCEGVDKIVVKIQALTDGIEIPDTPIAQIMDNAYNAEPEQTEFDFSDVLDAEEAAEEAMAAAAAPAPATAPAPAPAPAPAYEAPAPAPVYEAPAQPTYTYDQAPKIAPVVVDVSSIVEKAIAATMQKFSMAFDRRIEAFIAEHPVNLPAGGYDMASADAPALVSRTYGSDEILALESTILDDEKFLIEKLTEMMESLKTLTETMADISATYAELADKQANVNAVQKQTNDMQRHTLREQQGIQVSQRVIAQDQIAIAQDQALLTEQQTAIKDRQASVAEAQSALEETQRVVMENQSTLEKAMSSVMKTQKDLIAAHQAIVAGNTKNVELQKEVTDKQAETFELQKSALNAQKQLLRDQKGVNEKQKGGSQKKPKAPKVEEAVAPASEAEVAAEPENN